MSEPKSLAGTFLSLRDLADYSGLSVRTLRNHLRDTEHPLPSFKVGSKILVQRSEFDAWLSAYRRDPMARIDAIVADVLADLSSD